MSTARSIWWTKLLLFTTFVLVALGFIALKTVAMFGGSGDAAIFIRMQAGWKSGLLLYQEIFENKDFGFFALNAPLFRVLEVQGLVLASVMWTLVTVCGFYLLNKLFIKATAALAVAVLFGVLWVFGAWFRPLYPETLATALLVAGLALSFWRPFVAGLLLGALVSVKLNYAFGVASLLIGMAILEITQLRSVKVGFSTKLLRYATNLFPSTLRILFGVSVGFFAILLLSWISGVFKGWLDVIRVNIAYSQGANHSLIGGVSNFVISLGTNPIVIASFFVLILGLILHFFYVRRIKSLVYFKVLFLSFMAFLGTFAAISLQGSWESHNQPLAGLALATAGFTFCSLSAVSGKGYSDFRISGLLFSVSLVYVSALVFLPSNPVDSRSFRGFASSISGAWKSAGTPTPLDSFLMELPAGSSAALFITSNPRFDFLSAKNLHLICRFHFQWPGFLNTFRDEHIRCLDQRPAVVLWEDSRIYGDWYGYREYWEAQRERVYREYLVCHTVENLVVFVLEAKSCPRHERIAPA
jgi:hypothetical protein